MNSNLLNILIVVIVGVAGYVIAQNLYVDAPQTIEAPAAQNVAAQKNERIIHFAPEDRVPIAADGFVIQDLRGGKYSPADFRGKVVLVNFWATWCPPCVEEFPRLVDVAKTYEKDLVFLAISSDLGADVIPSFLTKMGLSDYPENMHVALDKTGAITRKIFKTYSLPETFVIDQDGYIRSKFIGADWTADELAAAIKSALP